MMMTKKVIALILGLGLYACGTKDEPTSNTTKKETQTNQANTPKAPGVNDTPSNPGTNNPTPNPAPTERPNDYHLGSRCQIEWTATDDKLYTDFDLESLWLDNKISMFTLAYLRPYIHLYSSSPDGKIYQFVEDDYLHTEVKTIKYNRAQEVIELQLTYKGIPSKVLKLPFRLNEFYNRRITFSTTFARERYAEGFSKHPDIYQGDLLRYNSNRYAVTISKDSGISVEDNAQTVSMTLRVNLKSSDEELVSIQKKLSGFRSLDKLREDLTIAHSYKTREFLSNMITKMRANEDLVTKLANTLPNWSRTLQLNIRGRNLIPVNNRDWEPEAITYQFADLYLRDVHFELKSARLEGRDLKMRIALTDANDVSISGVEYDLSIESVID